MHAVAPRLPPPPWLGTIKLTPKSETKGVKLYAAPPLWVFMTVTRVLRAGDDGVNAPIELLVLVRADRLGLFALFLLLLLL